MKNNYIKQAVILAGGRGIRLRPITDTIPKPMIQFYGKPFLEYLIENLKMQGINKILLLLGYLPKVIQDYFGDGKKFGIRIEYFISDVVNDTGKRMKLAERLIDPFFLFMYCDNYWPLNLKKMLIHFNSLDVLGQLTLYSNKDGYTKSNVRLNGEGLIVEYDKTRTAANLEAVDIGFGIFSKKILGFLPGDNVSFEKTVYPILVKQGKLAGYLTDHRYYSVSSHARLHLTEAFLKRDSAIILDRDGVLNKKAPKAEYIKNWGEFEWLPGAKEAVALLKKSGYKVILVSNQAGIARGAMSHSNLDEIHKEMIKDLQLSGGDIDKIYYCPHGWDEGCECRKPKPGMLFFAQRDFHLDLSKVYFIGDDVRDKQAGEEAGCRTLLLDDKFNLLKAVKEKILRGAN